ncbi:MAG: hypothetical protein J7497_11365, partial [Chitinophagaceae bacterium]|nr:hypothetical protein [Chitinophagaceae bacterium]
GTVIAIEHGGAVHLSNAEQPDELHDLEGISISEHVLNYFGIISPFEFKGALIKLEIGLRRSCLHIDNNSYQIKYFHQFQNKIFENTGGQIINPFEYDQ